MTVRTTTGSFVWEENKRNKNSLGTSILFMQAKVMIRLAKLSQRWRKAIYEEPLTAPVAIVERDPPTRYTRALLDHPESLWYSRLSESFPPSLERDARSEMHVIAQMTR